MSVLQSGVTTHETQNTKIDLLALKSFMWYHCNDCLDYWCKLQHDMVLFGMTLASEVLRIVAQVSFRFQRVLRMETQLNVTHQAVCFVDGMDICEHVLFKMRHAGASSTHTFHFHSASFWCVTSQPQAFSLPGTCWWDVGRDVVAKKDLQLAYFSSGASQVAKIGTQCAIGAIRHG